MRKSLLWFRKAGSPLKYFNKPFLTSQIYHLLIQPLDEQKKRREDDRTPYGVKGLEQYRAKKED